MGGCSGPLRASGTPLIYWWGLSSVADSWCGAGLAVVIDLSGGEGRDVRAGDVEAELVLAVEALADGALGRAVLRGEEADDGPVKPGGHDDVVHTDELVVGPAQERLGHAGR